MTPGHRFPPRTPSHAEMSALHEARRESDTLARMSLDPVVTNAEYYKVVFENDRVRVLQYSDQPGDVTTPHEHPDSVMYTLSSFRRRLVSGDVQREVALDAGHVTWLPAQEHHGENIGDTPTHVLFVELKGTDQNGVRPASEASHEIGPQSS
jgi:beta-alanine degradation protein BauB